MWSITLFHHGDHLLTPTFSNDIPHTSPLTHSVIFGAAITWALSLSLFGQCIHPCRWSSLHQSTSWVHQWGLSCLHLPYLFTTPTACHVDPQVFVYPYPHLCKPVPMRYRYRFGWVRAQVRIFTWGLPRSFIRFQLPPGAPPLFWGMWAYPLYAQ